VVEPHFLEARRQTAGLYRQMAGTGRTTNDLIDIVRAAYQGQIQFLFVPLAQENQPIHSGRFDPANQQVEIHERPKPGDEDLVDLALVFTLMHKGTIYSLEPEEIPDRPALAAIFWLPLGERRSQKTV